MSPVRVPEASTSAVQYLFRVLRMDARASEEGICCLAVVATFHFGKHEGTPVTKWQDQRRFQGAQVPVDGRKPDRNNPRITAS
jgi:hypothetical protein